MTTNKRESKSFDFYKRSNTDNLADSSNGTKKKRQGKSQFIKAKFDIDYDPKYRVFKSGGSHLDLKKKSDVSIPDEVNNVVLQAQDEVKKGRKIVIDWSQQKNFRITRFPSLSSNQYLPRRANTEEICLHQLDTPVKAKYYEYLEKYKGNSPFRQIADRGQYLKSLISDSMLDNRKRKRKIKIKLKGHQSNLTSNHDGQNSSIDQSNNEQRKGDPHFNYSIIEEVEEKRKQFFQKNSGKIREAIKYEQNLEESIHEKISNKKFKIEQIHQRIIWKSKLSLLKNDLIKKFKEIKQGVLDQASHVQKLKTFLQ